MQNDKCSFKYLYDYINLIGVYLDSHPVHYIAYVPKHFTSTPVYTSKNYEEINSPLFETSAGN